MMDFANIFIAQSDRDIADCFDAFKALRPHIEPQSFLAQVRRQQQQSYQIVAVRADNRVPSVAGFRIGEFLAWEKILYVDDLSTVPDARGHGYGGMLMDWLIAHAKSSGCVALHLDSGYARNAAHRLYLNKGMQLSSHHFSLTF